MPRPQVSVSSSRFIRLASVAVVVGALYFAQEVLVPIALAILLSFLLAPLVHRLEHLKLPRPAAVLLTVAISFGALGGVGYVVYNQLADLSSHMPSYRQNIQTKVQSFRSGNGFYSWFKNAREEVAKMALEPATKPAAAGQSPLPPGRPVPVVVTNAAPPEANSGISIESPLSLIGDVGAKVLGPVGTTFLVIILTIFMLLQREDLRDRFIRLVGRSQLTVTTQALDDAADRVSRYLLMQSIINGSVGLLVTIGLWLIGKINGSAFPSPALWGLLATLLRFIPYIGIWIAALMPMLLSLGVFSSATVALETLSVYLGIELIAANVMEPLLFGSSTGIAPLAVLVAAVFWTWLWGTVGLLLSTPLTVCLVVIGKYVPQFEFLNILLGDEPALEPPARVYQRLLALDQEESKELVHDYAEKMPLEELYDTILLPALKMAEWDRSQDNLDEERLEFILQNLREVVEELVDRQKIIASAAASELLVQQSREGGVPAEAVKPPAARALAEPTANVRTMLPKDCPVTVACLPAQNEADEIAGLMLGHLLEMRGYRVTVVSVEQLASEMVATVERLEADAVCVSALPPAAATHARYLCKRLHGKVVDLPMVVGLWGTTGDLKRSKQRIGCAQSVQVASTLHQALDQIHQLVQPKLMSREGGAAVIAKSNGS